MPNDSNTPLLSIITAVKNDCKGLAQTKLSLEKQLFRNFEWIVIDGASTDGILETDAAIKGLATSFYSQPDSGVYAAMNIGLQKAKGRFLLFLNAGDMLTNESTLENLAPYFESDQFDFLYGNSIQWQGQTKLYKISNGHHNLPYGMFACHQAMYFSSTAVGRLRYDERFKVSGDYDFTARFLKKINNIIYVDDFLCQSSPPGLSLQFKQTGRRENWIVQKQTIGVSLGGRLLAVASSSCMQLLSKFSPVGYKYLQQFKVKNRVFRFFSNLFRSAQ